MYYETWDHEEEAAILDAINKDEGIFDQHVEALMNHATETCSTKWECRYNEHGNPEAWLA